VDEEGRDLSYVYCSEGEGPDGGDKMRYYVDTMVVIMGGAIIVEIYFSD
jgi:hypothetical protein